MSNGPQKNKSKSPTIKEKRIAEFNRLQKELLEQGYKEKDLIISPLKANIMGIATTLPIAIACSVLYLTFYNMKYLYTLWDAIFMLLTFILGAVVHELIHGASWSAFCEKKWAAISFGIDIPTLTPYCCCNEGLTLKKYSLGCAMPGLLLGVFPYIIGLITGNFYFAFFGVMHILLAGGDAYMLLLVRKEKTAILVDHPYLVGCVSFEK